MSKLERQGDGNRVELEQMSTADMGTYSWLNGPWPWELEGGQK